MKFSQLLHSAQAKHSGELLTDLISKAVSGRRAASDVTECMLRHARLLVSYF